MTIDANDDNYMPFHIVTYGGEIDNLKKLQEVNVDQWVSFYLISFGSVNMFYISNANSAPCPSILNIFYPDL